MASLTVYNKTGKEVGKYDIEPADLAPRISKQLLHDVVVMYQSNLRLGTARTRSRAEVAGSVDMESLERAAYWAERIAPYETPKLQAVLAATAAVDGAREDEIQGLLASTLTSRDGDRMVGPDFDSGLAQLKAAAEKP